MEAMSSVDVQVLGREYRIFGYPSEGWFEILKNRGMFGEWHLADLPKLMKPDSVCIDAGANLGMYTLVMSQCAPQGRVLAFEPDGPTYSALAQTIAAAKCANVDLYPWVLGSANTERGRFVEDPQWRSSSHFVFDPTGKVMVHTIDNLGLDRLDLLKIDVEGSEIDVLDGARETLRRHRPTVVMEFNSFAFVHYRNLVPRDAMVQIRRIFPQVRYWDRKTGVLVEMGNPEDFLRRNMLEGFVDDLLCTWE